MERINYLISSMEISKIERPLLEVIEEELKLSF